MIGYYVHHHGSGHLHRAMAIAHHLSDRMTLLGSLGPADTIPAPYVELARDDEPPPRAADDVTAGGALHWAPLAHGGLRARSATLARWLAQSSTDLLVSDVSVEALLLARLMSVPPVAIAQRGDRTDRAHANGYDAAARIIAPWIRETQPEWPVQWLVKTTWVGMISRFDQQPRRTVACGPDGMCVVMLLGQGGHSLRPQDLVEASNVSDVHWHVLGTTGFAPPTDRLTTSRVLVHGRVPDVWPWLCSADVIVAAAGTSAIADVAAARAALIAIPQDRPFDEQLEQSRILEEHGLCVAAPPWPTRTEWPGLLERAAKIGGDGWAEHSDGFGARRAATTLDKLALDSKKRSQRA